LPTKLDALAVADSQSVQNFHKYVFVSKTIAEE